MRIDRALIIALVFVCAAAYVRAQESEGSIVTPDKVKIFYKIEGSGPDTVVVVHGGPGNTLESVRGDLTPLAKGRRVIYYDQRGQGRSEVVTDGKKLGYENHVADLEALRQHFKLEKITLFGNSWGGLLASLYAVAHPDRIERMVLHHPAGPSRGMVDDMGEEVSRRMNKMYTPEQLERARFAEKSANWQKATDPVALCREFYMMVLKVYTYSQTLNIPFKGDVCAGPIETLRLQRAVNAHAWRSLGDFDLTPKLLSVKAPVLVIHGAGDVIPLRSSEFWAFGYPNGRLFVIEKSGHISQAETPDILFPAVETFLKGSFPVEAKKVTRSW